MSAVEVIEQIKALPPEEKARVVEFVHQLEIEVSALPASVRFAAPEQAQAAGQEIVKQYEIVFRKLAE